MLVCLFGASGLSSSGILGDKSTEVMYLNCEREESFCMFSLSVPAEVSPRTDHSLRFIRDLESGLVCTAMTS